jgi:hypothetical protein
MIKNYITWHNGYIREPGNPDFLISTKEFDLKA